MKIFLNSAKILFFFILMTNIYSCKKDKEESKLPVSAPKITVEKILDNYEIIWGMDFLPNGDLVFGEKRGKLYKKSSQGVSEISGLPTIDSGGQGGLLDIRVHPQYTANGWIYITYTSSTPYSSLKLSRFKILNNKIENFQNLFTASGPTGHNGSRIAFDKQGYLYLSVGEGPSTGGGLSGINKNSLDPSSSWGKVHRFYDDGRIPNTNPILPGNSTYNSIFTYGHRNPQGLVLNPNTGDIWLSEHGPMGGDEINILSSGANYGWPKYSLGINYDGSKISDGHTALGITEPIYSWKPSIGTCGVAFIKGTKFKSWVGSLLVSGLASQKLHRCFVDGNKIVSEEIVLKDLGRVRNVVQGPDEAVYVSVEGPGRVYRIVAE